MLTAPHAGEDDHVPTALPNSESSTRWISDLKCNAQFTGCFPSKGGFFPPGRGTRRPTPVRLARSRCAAGPTPTSKAVPGCGPLPSPPGIPEVEDGYDVVE